MWNIYLSGEIHTDWREQIISRCEALKLPVNFSSAITDHAASDAAGDHLADTATSFWRDNQSAKVNAIRTKMLLLQENKKLKQGRNFKLCQEILVQFG